MVQGFRELTATSTGQSENALVPETSPRWTAWIATDSLISGSTTSHQYPSARRHVTFAIDQDDDELAAVVARPYQEAADESW
jgi:hypothetical protein